MKVLVPNFMHKSAISTLKDAGLEVQVSDMNDAKTILSEAKDSDGIIANTFNFSADILNQLPKTKLITRFGVGYDSVDLEAAKANGIIVSHTPGANANSVAEFTLSLMLSLVKQLPMYNSVLHSDQQISRDNSFDATFSNKTIGLVGYGDIAKRVEELLHPFGVKILIANRTKREIRYGTQVEFDDLIHEADIISIHVPDTKDTHHLFDQKVFSAMKKSAILINTGRGGLIKEADLISALQNHEIFAAGLDVFAEEPLPINSPLRSLPNVLLTPHVAGNTVEALTKMSSMAAEETIRVLVNNQNPNWQVN